MKRLALILALALPMTGAFAQPDPVGGPSWWTHPPGSTTRLQYHSFITHPSLNLLPDYTEDGFVPSFGDTWLVNHAPVNLGGQNPLYGDGHGYAVGPNDPFRKYMGNMRQPTWVKEWFVQVVWTDFTPAPGAIPVLTVTAPGGVVIGDGLGLNTQPVPGSATVPWKVTTWRGTIDPQPDYEIFDFAFPTQTGALTVVDSLWIGTRCVPEPATMATMGIGLAFAAARRKRAKR